MSAALVLALISTLTLLALMISFLFGSAPMLFLKHASPVDSLVVRGAFNTYYWVALVIAAASASSYAFAGFHALALGAAVLAVVAVVLRLLVIPKMDTLHARLQAGQPGVVPDFRRWHVFAVLMNLGLLVATFLTLVTFPVDLTATGLR